MPANAKPPSEDHSESRLIAEVGLIGAVAQWCECLHGRDPLLKSLEILAHGLGAEIVALVRYARDGAGSMRMVTWDSAAAEGTAGRADRGFARSLMGPYFEAARPGSLWFRSMVEEGTSADLDDFHAARHLRELVVIPLETGARFVDTIEVHFRDRLRNHQQLILNSVAPVLSVENPARLSRAEYRVSLLLSRGLSIEQVKSELRIRESTLRSHLGNLYAKTNCANLSELIFRLTSQAPVRTGPARQARSA